jgi:hypothetical protein
MADLGTIGIAIEVRGREALRQIESDMSAVDRTAKSAARSFEAFERAGLKTAETFRYMSDAATKRLAQEQKVTQELVKQRGAAEQLARANAQRFQSQIGGNLGLGARGISAGASASAMEGEIERLRLKYDQIYASSQLYEKSLLELNQAHILGVTSVKQHEAAVESLNVEYQNFQNGVALAGNRFATHVNQTSTGMNKFGMAAQQTGYQVSDFLVQIQGGTNPLVAFSQQATQLTGLLYIMSPALLASRLSFIAFSISMSTAIAGVTILVPLLAMLAMAFANSGAESDKAANGIDKQAQAYDALIARVEQLRLARQMEATGISTVEEQIVQNNLNTLLEQRTVLQERLNDLQSLGGRGAGFAEQVNEQKALLQVEIDKNDEAIKAVTYQQQLETAARRRANEERNAYREAKAEADRWKASLEGIKSVLDTINGMALNVTLNVQENMSDYAKSVFDRFREISAIGPLWNNPAAATRPRRAPALLDENLIDTPSGGGGGRQADLRKEIELTKELTAAEKERQTILQSIEGSLESGFMAMVDGTKSVKDAFRIMARDIIKELYNVLVVQRLVGSFDVAKGTGSGLVGFLGKAFTGQLATGGSVMPGKSYLVGENGPELVIPRHSGTVVNANQTANAAGGNGTTVVNNNISVTGSDAAMVRAEVAKMIPQITNATKAAVIDARLRGGQMKAAFT